MAEFGGWDVVRAAVREQIGPHAYDAWFRTLDCRLEDDGLVVECPDRFSLEWIRDRYDDVLKRACGPDRAIDYRLASSSPAEAPNGPPPEASAPSAQAAGAPGFENFVVEPGNALALEAARAVAGGAAGRCSPLFIAAPSGLGKTHLCRAIQGSLGTASTYRSAEGFTTEVTEGIRGREMHKVRRRYRRSRNVLVLEDVQFLAGKRQTQIELFHTLDHLIETGCPVVLSGDRPPLEIPDLDAELASRMAAGLVARIASPELPARRQILREKAARGGVRLPEDCLERLALRPVRSVRDLLAGLNQTVARASLLRRPITLELVGEALEAAGSSRRPRTIEEIRERVARSYALGVEELTSRSRRRRVVRPRQIAMYLCRQWTDASLKDIGRAFGRDHTSVMYAVEVVERRLLERPQLRYEIEDLATRF